EVAANPMASFVRDQEKVAPGTRLSKLIDDTLSPAQTVLLATVVTVGRGLTVSTTSSVAVPQATALVETRFSVTVPVLPLRMLTLVVALLVLTICTSLFVIVPVTEAMLHEAVPLPTETPTPVKLVEPSVSWHRVLSSPALAVGLGLTVRT